MRMRTGWLLTGLAVLGVTAAFAACRKGREEPPTGTPGGPAENPPATTPDPGEADAVENVEAAAEETPPAEEDGGAAVETGRADPVPSPAAGGLLAGLLGGGAPARRQAPEPSAMGRLVERAESARSAESDDAPAEDPALLDGPGGGDPTFGSPVRPDDVELPPADTRVCDRMVPRVLGCLQDATGQAPTGEEMEKAIAECRAEMLEMPPELLSVVGYCVDLPDCDDAIDCLAGVNEAWGGGDGPAAVEDPGLDDPFGPPPDPARVAQLPASSRDLCEQLARRFDACWEDLIGLAGAEIDDETRATVDQMRPQMLEGIRTICLGAALDEPDTFREMEAARPCFARPCAEMLDCITATQQ